MYQLKGGLYQGGPYVSAKGGSIFIKGVHMYQLNKFWGVHFLDK